MDYYATKLADAVPKTWGASDLIDPIIQNFEDIHILIKLIYKANEITKENSKKENPDLYTLEDILDTLTEKFITFSMEQIEPLLVFASSDIDLHTIEDVFENLSFKFLGQPQFLERNIPKDELLQLFVSYEPEKKQNLKKLLAKMKQNAGRILKRLRNCWNKEYVDAKQKKKSPKKENVIYEKIIKAKEYSPEELYILEQTFKQKVIFSKPEESAQRIARQCKALIKKDIEEGSKDWTKKTAEQLREEISRGSDKIGIGLTDIAWQNIDNEQDLEILQVLAILAVATNDSKSFWDWRAFFMENKQAWKYFKEE